MADDEIHVALCADQHILPGVHVTLSSMMRSLSGGRTVGIHLFHLGFTTADVQALRDTLDQAGAPYRLDCRPVEDGVMDGLGGIRGNAMAWARFFLPDWLPDLSKVVYLDSDLLVTCDVGDLFDWDLGGAAAGFVHNGKGRMRTSLESDLFESLGFDLESPYYNSGVIVMDLDAWRDWVSEEGLAFAREQGGHLPSADQTALNVVFRRHPVAHIDARYNRILYPADPLPDEYRTGSGLEPGIYHFLGAPKPWDLFGEWVHEHGALFGDALEHTAMAGWRSYRSPSWSSARIAARNAKAYARAVRRRVRP